MSASFDINQQSTVRSGEEEDAGIATASEAEQQNISSPQYDQDAGSTPQPHQPDADNFLACSSQLPEDLHQDLTTPVVLPADTQDSHRAQSVRPTDNVTNPSGLRTPPLAASSISLSPGQSQINLVTNLDEGGLQEPSARPPLPQVSQLLSYSEEAEMMANLPVLKQPESPITSDVRVPTGDELPLPKPPRVKVLYKVACTGKTSGGSERRINRYSTEPFPGLDYAENRHSLSVMDVLDNTQGMWPDPIPGRTAPHNQIRELFGTKNFDRSKQPFDLNIDFIQTSGGTRAIRIMSASVIAQIKDKVQYWHEELKDEELYINQPFELLAFTYKGLREAAEKGPTGDSKGQTTNDAQHTEASITDLKVVLDWYRDSHYEKDVVPELEVHGRGMATYSKLWLLFRPGMTVSVEEDGQVEFYKVRTITHPMKVVMLSNSSQKAMSDEASWLLSLWQLDFKGVRLSRRARTTSVKIPRYPGERQITKLPAVPIEHMDLSNESRQTHINRGKTYYDMNTQAPVLKSYYGALSGNKTLRYSGPVVVDPSVCSPRVMKPDGLGTVAKPADTTELAKFKEPSDGGGGPLYSYLNDLTVGAKSPFEEDELMYLLFPANISGFALGKRQWAQFDVASFADDKDESEEHTEAFNNLTINPQDWDILKALADSTRTQESSLPRSDFIDGKGQGKYVLLYGPPGVGKSFTVESLANYLHRPLLLLTVADIGTNQVTAERNLSSWLDLAQRWDAIVLLDEADTYLEKRERGGFLTNTLVAAFLRVLEYYPSLIFLTTNKPGWLDDAFMSRFHLCVEYPELDQDMRLKVWEKFLYEPWEMPGEVSIKVAKTDQVLGYVTGDAVTKLSLNGRDIRNAFQAAATLAQFKHVARANLSRSNKPISKTVCVTIDDFKAVIGNKIRFLKYMEDAWEADENKRAAFDRSRRPAKKPEPKGKEPEE